MCVCIEKNEYSASNKLYMYINIEMYCHTTTQQSNNTHKHHHKFIKHGH